jgi:hypothetical protein
VTQRRWGALWVVLALFTAALAVAIADGMRGPLLGNLWVLAGFTYCIRWLGQVWRRWKPPPPPVEVEPLGKVEWPAQRR